MAIAMHESGSLFGCAGNDETANPVAAGTADRDMKSAIEVIRNAVASLVASGVDGKTIAISLCAASMREMTGAYGKEEACRLAVQMYLNSGAR